MITTLALASISLFGLGSVALSIPWLQDWFKYYSRKVTRWFGALFVTVGVVFGLLAAATVWPVATLAVGLGGFAAFLMASRFQTGGLGRACEIVMAVFATSYGVYLGMKGRTFADLDPGHFALTR